MQLPYNSRLLQTPSTFVVDTSRLSFSLQSKRTTMHSMAKTKENVGIFLALQTPVPLTKSLSSVVYHAYRFELEPEYRVLRGKSSPLSPSEALAWLLPEEEKKDEAKPKRTSLRGHIRNVSSGIFRGRKSRSPESEDTESSTTTRPKHFPLLQLPPELRLVIYTHCSAFTLLNMSHTCRALRNELTVSSPHVQRSPGFRLAPDYRIPCSFLTILNIAGVPSPLEAKLVSQLFRLYPRMRCDRDGPRMLHARHETCSICGKKKMEMSKWEDVAQCFVWRQNCGCVSLKEWCTKESIGRILRAGRDLRFVRVNDGEGGEWVAVGDKPVSDKWYMGQPVPRSIDRSGAGGGHFPS
ncbi:hypothetical protein BJ508DRAFT_156600 [Ascobolus immersus RN42]|uniref:F-box domain-containing protein n=1 Tax=Ascobolus immersus RN42 TaxID=1160509 RepID=A0A3N4HWJ2_ASCIM|nr:hypothetical protein BJ508DRAFT_156600 [Ascobolus immersus RN42]